MSKQFLLFSKPRNFHFVFLDGRPVGFYSLRNFCIKSILESPHSMDTVDMAHGSVIVNRPCFKEAFNEKIALQKMLIENFKCGNSPYRPFWMKQRLHYKKFLNAARNGESLVSFLE